MWHFHGDFAGCHIDRGADCCDKPADSLLWRWKLIYDTDKTFLQHNSSEPLLKKFYGNATSSGTVCQFDKLVRNGACDYVIQDDPACKFDVDDCRNWIECVKLRKKAEEDCNLVRKTPDNN